MRLAPAVALSVGAMAAIVAVKSGPSPKLGVQVAATCESRAGLPDPTCTPGATDPRVTQENIQQTICVPGYSANVRPPVSVTNPIKAERMRAYGITAAASIYELDHLIPLSIGGAPRDPKNLWSQAWDGELGARSKDTLETWLHREVCAGAISLVQAQRMAASNWVDAYRAVR